MAVSNKRELYYQVAHSHLSEQDGRNQLIEQKASGALALSSALVGIAAIVIKDFSGTSSVPLTGITLFFGTFMAVAFVATAGLSFRTLWIRSWQRTPDLKAFSEHLSNPIYEDEGMVEWVGDEFARSVEHNDRILNTKVDALRGAMIALVAEVAALAGLALSIRL